MKKMLALLLAMLLALSCTLALAETAEAPAFQGLTIQSEYDVNIDALNNLLTGMGMDENTMTIVDAVASIIDQAGEKLVISNQGAQAELLLKDASLLNMVALVGQDGITLGSNLVPSYALKISPADMLRMLADMIEKQEAATGGLDMAVLQEALTGHFQNFINTCMGAVAQGEPEQGDFEMDGVSYNVRVPMTIDMATIVEAANTLVNDLNNDENVKAALEKLQGMGVNMNLEGSSEPVDTANLPAVTVDMYMNIDESGNQSGATLVAVNVTLAGEADPATTVYVTVNGNSVTVDANFISANTQVIFNGEQDEADPMAFSCRLDAYVNEAYFGVAGVSASTDQGMQFDAYLYVLDSENALASEHGTLTLNGELTLGVSDSATVLTLADLNGEKASDTITGVAMDAFGGLMSILPAASEQMPEEFGAIMSLFSGILGGGAAEEPAA